MIPLTTNIATPTETIEGIEVYFVQAGEGCMANDPAYYKAWKDHKLGTGSTREEAVTNLRENIAAEERHKALQISLHPLNILANRCRQANDSWWRDPITNEPIKRNKGELIALIHSEISECLEGLRKNLPDDHLPQFPMELVELADALVRIFDYVGEFYPASENDNGINLGNAFEQKMAYNAQRKDHKPENRILDKGKRF